MTLVERQNDWLYTAHPLTTPADRFGVFASAVGLWRSKAPADGGLPRKRDFQALDFRGWFGRVIIYEVIGDQLAGPDFDLRVRLYGTDFVDCLRMENTGKRFSEAYGQIPGHDVTVRYFSRLAERKLIGISGGPLSWERLDMHSGVFAELPVADDTGAVRFFFTFGQLGGEQICDTVPLMREARMRAAAESEAAPWPVVTPVAANDIHPPRSWRRWL